MSACVCLSSSKVRLSCQEKEKAGTAAGLQGAGGWWVQGFGQATGKYLLHIHMDMAKRQLPAGADPQPRGINWRHRMWESAYRGGLEVWKGNTKRGSVGRKKKRGSKGEAWILGLMTLDLSTAACWAWHALIHPSTFGQKCSLCFSYLSGFLNFILNVIMILC